MLKKKLETARKTWATGINTEQLKARVVKDLEPVKDTYDIAYQAIQQIQALIASVPSEERPVRAMRELAAALRDAAGVLVSMRAEGRDTVSYSAAAQQGTTAPAPAPAVQQVARVLNTHTSALGDGSPGPRQDTALDTTRTTSDPHVADPTDPVGGVVRPT